MTDETQPTAGLSASEREKVAVNVLDLTLLELQRRLRENPDKVQASGIAEVVKLLGLWFRFREKIGGSGERDQADFRALLENLPQYSDDDEYDPLLDNQGRGEHQQPNVTPGEIESLATFDD